jgi:hypothetical protein
VERGTCRNRRDRTQTAKPALLLGKVNKREQRDRIAPLRPALRASNREVPAPTRETGTQVPRRSSPASMRPGSLRPASTLVAQRPVVQSPLRGPVPAGAFLRQTHPPIASAATAPQRATAIVRWHPPCASGCALPRQASTGSQWPPRVHHQPVNRARSRDSAHPQDVAAVPASGSRMPRRAQRQPAMAEACSG